MTAEGATAAGRVISLLAGRGKGELRTAELRRIAAATYRDVRDEDLGRILDQCEILLEVRKWAPGVVAYDWAYRARGKYDEGTCGRFEKWLNKYIGGWGDCDDFCTHAFGALMAGSPERLGRLKAWTVSGNRLVRRAAAVTLIYPIRRNLLGSEVPLSIADSLLGDGDRLVLKGLGWMLKELAVPRREEVVAYLAANRKVVPPSVIRYAIERLDEADRARVRGA